MMLHFIKTSSSVETIGLNFFETSHGQSEGDSMHIVIKKENETTVGDFPSSSVGYHLPNGKGNTTEIHGMEDVQPKEGHPSSAVSG